MIANGNVALISLLMTIVGMGFGFFLMFLIVKDNLQKEVTSTLTSFLNMVDKFGKSVVGKVFN